MNVLCLPVLWKIRGVLVKRAAGRGLLVLLLNYMHTTQAFSPHTPHYTFSKSVTPQEISLNPIFNLIFSVKHCFVSHSDWLNKCARGFWLTYHWVFKDLPQVTVSVRGVIVSSGNQSSKLMAVCNVHENPLQAPKENNVKFQSKHQRVSTKQWRQNCSNLKP